MNRIPRLDLKITALVLVFLLQSCNLGINPGVAISSETTNTIVRETASPTASTRESCPASPPEMTVTIGNIRLCFLNLENGQVLSAKPGESIRILAEASGVNVVGITFTADVTDQTFVPNTASADPFRAEWEWKPSGGSKTYQLKLEAITADKSAIGEAAISVQITGLPSITAASTEASATVDPAVRSKLADLLKQSFNLTVPFPPIARKQRQGVTDPWVSTLYLGGNLYDVEQFADGHTELYKTPVFPNTQMDPNLSLFKIPVCKPAGIYSMLVVFLDFGNLSVSHDEVLADLQTATQMANTEYAAYPSGGAGSLPILQINTTGVVIPPPPGLFDHRLPPQLVKKYTGLDPAAFNWMTQVDLDSSYTARKAWGGISKTSNGYAYSGCEATKSDVNIWVGVDSKEQLTGDYNLLSEALLTHEVFHLFGYPASHLWPCTDGPQIDRADQCSRLNMPALMLGWMDTDGDGIPEIMDPTPYGVISP